MRDRTHGRNHSYGRPYPIVQDAAVPSMRPEYEAQQQAQVAEEEQQPDAPAPEQQPDAPAPEHQGSEAAEAEEVQPLSQWAIPAMPNAEDPLQDPQDPQQDAAEEEQWPDHATLQSRHDKASWLEMSYCPDCFVPFAFVGNLCFCDSCGQKW